MIALLSFLETGAVTFTLDCVGVELVGVTGATGVAEALLFSILLYFSIIRELF
jgi:hypothetical protein